MYARSFVRAASKAAGPSFRARASFATGTKLRNAEVIAATEIPRTSYKSGSAEYGTIQVGENASIVPPATAEKVVPLTKPAYKSMTPMMQKMTLMDKVVVVTG